MLLCFSMESAIKTLEVVLDSIRRHTYASLAIFVRRSGGANAVCDQYADAEFLDDVAFPDALNHIRSRVRAPYFVLVTEPVRFSKHWLGQLAEVAGNGPTLEKLSFRRATSRTLPIWTITNSRDRHADSGVNGAASTGLTTGRSLHARC